ARRVELAEAEADSENFTPIEPQDTLAIEEALLELAQLSPEKARLIELRFFGGLTEVEAAKVMGISRSSIKRQWRLVRAWLSSRLGSGEDG
ncbi:MAG: ECF-type sigma factor, partial [Planctomycetota bacterium]